MKSRARDAAIIIIIILALAGACRTGLDYPGAAGPRYVGGPAAAANENLAAPDTLRIVSFNIAFARHIDQAIVLLSSDPDLRGADVLLLQEMDGPATQQIAQSLGMWYVYYPAIHHRRTKRDFGNAILSRWPVVDDAKLVLPHASRYAGTHRIATAATLEIGTSRVRVYSTHLGTALDIGSGRRRDQLRAILEEAAGHPLVIIGGDLNDAGVGNVALETGFAWPTQRGPKTTRFGRWDHIFLKGLTPPDSAASGTIGGAGGISDHLPIWTRAILP